MNRRRELAAALTVVLASRAAGLELQPLDEYGAGWTFLGAMGGAAFGTVLGGLTRSDGASRVKPFLRWGAVGSLFGGVLGREVAADAVGRARADETVEPRPTRETNALLGTLAGELAGFGIGALQTRRVTRDSREVWAGVSLGALLGAAGGLLLPAPKFLAPPSTRSAARREQDEEQRRVIAAQGPSPDAAGYASRAESDRLRTLPYAPAGSPGASASLRDALMLPEDERMVREGSLPLLRHEPAPMILPDLPPDGRLVALGRSVLTLGLLEGAVLGAAAGGAVTGEAGGYYARLATGAGVGALAGWSATAALAQPWTDRSQGWTDAGEGFEQGRRTGTVLIGGMIGTLLGAGAGASIHNGSPASFTRTDIALSALAGNLTGLLAGYLFTAPRPTAR